MGALLTIALILALTGWLCWWAVMDRLTATRLDLADAQAENSTLRDAGRKAVNHGWTAVVRAEAAEREVANLTAAYLRLDAEYARPTAVVTELKKPVKRAARKTAAVTK